MIIASFWVLRPEEHPEAEARNYPGMLKVLQRSCDRLRLKHVVLTDERTAFSAQWPAGIEACVLQLPEPLMRAATEAQARFLEASPNDDVMFVGADCVMLKDPQAFYPIEAGICVTYRDPVTKYPINTGAQVIRKHSMEAATKLYRRVADRCGTVWCDDQLALVAELSPMPVSFGMHERHGIKVGFLTMKRRNVVPRTIADRCELACMVHFRGKARKKFFFEWATRQGYA